MAGYTRLYCIGSPGGSRGTGGLGSMRLQIWVWEGRRLWLQSHALDPGIVPVAGITRVIPEAPGGPDGLLDACLIFCPDHFAGGASLEQLREELELRAEPHDGERVLEWSSLPRRLRALWAAAREEARGAFGQLTLYEAVLEPVHGTVPFAGAAGTAPPRFRGPAAGGLQAGSGSCLPRL